MAKAASQLCPNCLLSNPLPSSPASQLNENKHGCPIPLCYMLAFPASFIRSCDPREMGKMQEAFWGLVWERLSSADEKTRHLRRHSLSGQALCLAPLLCPWRNHDAWTCSNGAPCTRGKSEQHRACAAKGWEGAGSRVRPPRLSTFGERGEGLHCLGHCNLGIQLHIAKSLPK